MTDIFVAIFWMSIRGGGMGVSQCVFISSLSLTISNFPCEKQFRCIWSRGNYFPFEQNCCSGGWVSPVSFPYPFASLGDIPKNFIREGLTWVSPVRFPTPLATWVDIPKNVIWERAWPGSVLHCCTARPASGQQEEGSCRGSFLPQRSWLKVVKMMKAILLALVTIFAIAEAGRIRRDTDECDKITVAHKECVKTWVSSFDFAPPKRLSYYILNWSFTSIRGLKITQNLLVIEYFRHQGRIGCILYIKH